MWCTRLFGILTLPVLGLAVAGCVGSSGPPRGAELGGVMWTVTSFPGHGPLPPGLRADVTFENGKMSGSDGCNYFGGSYSTSSGGGIEITGGQSTAIGCPGPVDDFGFAYHAALGQAASYQMNGDWLTLYNAAGAAILRYRANADPPLAGLTWKAFGYRNGPVDDKQAVVSLVPGSTITAVFGTDGKLTGSSGCNTYTADFTIRGNEIEIGSPTTTRIECAAKLMDQELAYLSALGSTTSWQFSGTAFQLLNVSGTVEATFAPA